MDETRREALGRFLRTRRERLKPERVGLSSRRDRRTPGLRREEVAFLADIGAKWYARLEAGDDINPSAETLTRIAAALRLTPAEFQYVQDLAGTAPHAGAGVVSGIDVPPVFETFLAGLHGVAASVADRILTPLCWNVLSDALYGHSRFDDPVERNGVVRCLLDPEFKAFLGDAQESMAEKAVGMFRLNYGSKVRSPLADRVYEKVKDNEQFRRFWEQRVIADELNDSSMMFLRHTGIGEITVYGIDHVVHKRPYLFTRIVFPADEETVAKFAELEKRAGG